MENMASHVDFEDYEFFESNVPYSENTVVVEPKSSPPWIEPKDIKLKHRIGRGPFGDVWLATLHCFNEDFDEFHEVAVKMLSFVNNERVLDVPQRFYHIFQKCQNLQGVNWPRGISNKNEKICIVSKFYEGSIGQKMAHLKENRLPLAAVIRYGLDIARDIKELHSVGIMALNLKPCNFLLDNQNKVILGDFALPLLLLGTSQSDNEQNIWLGTPNYMAPEQWNPDLRGPLCFETDAWGFACSIIEMLTGLKPWHRYSADDIFYHVVRRREKPNLPSDLPPAIQYVLDGCFEYDCRNRPSFGEIVRAFESPDVLFKEGDWINVQNLKFAVVKTILSCESLVVQYFDKKSELINRDRISKLSLWKHTFKAGDVVKLKSHTPKDTNVCESIRTEGTVISIEKETGTVLVKFSESQDPVEVSPAAIERVSSGFCVGDLVRLRNGWPSNSLTSSEQIPSSVGLVNGIESNGKLKIAFLGQPMLWLCDPAELDNVKPFHVGQFVRLRSDVTSPHFQWPLKKDRSWDTGRIARIAPNGALIVKFPGNLWNRDEWWADPEEVHVVQMKDYDNFVDKYHHLEAIHWIVRPLMLALVSFVTVKVGASLVRILPLPGRKRKLKESKGKEKIRMELVAGGRKHPTLGNPVWLPSSMANILQRGS